MSLLTAKGAKFIELGSLNSSKFWNNLYVKFEIDGKEIWLYYSEHTHKPYMYQQIQNFFRTDGYKVGDTMDVLYEIKQSANKSTKLLIKNIENHKRKN